MYASAVFMHPVFLVIYVIVGWGVPSVFLGGALAFIGVTPISWIFSSGSFQFEWWEEVPFTSVVSLLFLLLFFFFRDDERKREGWYIDRDEKFARITLGLFFAVLIKAFIVEEMIELASGALPCVAVWFFLFLKTHGEQ